MDRPWQIEKDLAALLLARSRRNRPSIITPDTAVLIADALMHQGDKPTRNEIALMLCSSRCTAACYACMGRANIVAAAYGVKRGE
jgi:hypothetical protein